MAAWSRLSLREAFTDFPPPIRDAAGRPRSQHHVAAIDRQNYYCGDTVFVSQKPARYPVLAAAVLRGAVLAWANRIGNLEGVPRPKPDRVPRRLTGRPRACRKDVLGVAKREG